MRKRIIITIVAILFLLWLGGSLYTNREYSYSLTLHSSAEQAEQEGTLVGTVAFGSRIQQACGVKKGWIESGPSRWRTTLLGIPVITIRKTQYYLGVRWDHWDPEHNGAQEIDKFTNNCAWWYSANCAGLDSSDDAPNCTLDLSTSFPHDIKLRLGRHGPTLLTPVHRSQTLAEPPTNG